MKPEPLSQNPEQTKRLGQLLAEETLKRPLGKRAFVLALKGDLGGGKTTFLQGFALGLGLRQRVTSPTFIIVKRFSLSNSKFRDFYHVDCYRLKEPKELTALGFREIIADPQNIVAIEWAEKVRKIVPKSATWIIFNLLDKDKREIVIKSR